MVIEKKPNGETEKRVYHNQWGQGKRMYNGIMSILQSLSDGVSPYGEYKPEPLLKVVELKNMPSFKEYYQNPISKKDKALLDQANVDEISTIKKLFDTFDNNDGGAVIEIEWLQGRKCTAYNNCKPFTTWSDEVQKNIGRDILHCVYHNVKRYVGIHHIDYPTDNTIVVPLSDGYGRELKDTITLNCILSEDKKNIEGIDINSIGSHSSRSKSIEGPIDMNEVINDIYDILDDYIPSYRVRVGFLVGFGYNDKPLSTEDDTAFKKYVSPERFREVEGYCGKTEYFNNNFFNAFIEMCKFSDVEWLQ